MIPSAASQTRFERCLGAVLADPERLLEGTGKGLRHVKIRSLAEASRPLIRALVATALVRRRSGATGPSHIR